MVFNTDDNFIIIGLERLISLFSQKESNTIVKKNRKRASRFNCDNSECSLANHLKNRKISKHDSKVIKSELCSVCRYYLDKTNKLYVDDFNIKEFLNFSKSQVLQLLLYHSMCTSNGLIMSVSSEDIKNIICVSDSTIKSNNKLFVEKELIRINLDNETKLMDVKILKYEEYFKSKLKNGHGYVKIDRQSFERLFKLNSLNELRGALKEIITNSEINY
jgi:hypothetical protein